MSQSNPNEDVDEAAQAAATAGIDPREVAALARLTDHINRFPASVLNVGAVTPTDYGIAVDTTLYIQTREPQAEAATDEGVETERADDAGEVEPEPIVEDEETTDDEAVAPDA